jgi:hypothetical protein
VDHAGETARSNDMVRQEELTERGRGSRMTQGGVGAQEERVDG